MAQANAEALKLPDQLIIRYFRDGEIDAVATVASDERTVVVTLRFTEGVRVDRWSDLGGGLGFVPQLGET